MWQAAENRTQSPLQDALPLGHGPCQDLNLTQHVLLFWPLEAMELARECIRLWGYKRIEEIVWVKTNQLQRIIRTGRTGHWINHAKEHCLGLSKGAWFMATGEVWLASKATQSSTGLVERFPKARVQEPGL